MGDMARLIAKQGVAPVIVDFVCPTDLTRAAFGKPDILIWVDRIESGRFEDTNKMWEDPESCDVRIPCGMTVEEEADLIITACQLHDWTAPTTLISHGMKDITLFTKRQGKEQSRYFLEYVIHTIQVKKIHLSLIR
jgi:hypothetical protein